MSRSLHAVEVGNQSVAEIRLDIPPPSAEKPPAPHAAPVPRVLPSIRFATPMEAEIRAFADLYSQHFGVSLEPAEAAFVAAKYLHMFQILTHED